MKRVVSILSVFTLALLISACNYPFAANSEDDMATSVAATVDAMESHVVIVQPTLAPLPTQTPQATATAEPENWHCGDNYDQPCYDDQYQYKCDDGHDDCWDPNDKNQCLYAYFVEETIEDNTVFSAGDSFTKTWTLRNTGYCDWNEDYHLVFKSGTQMDGDDDVLFGIEVDPGEEITLSLSLTAPSTAGTYTGYWQLETDDDVKFGSALSVKIEVE